MANHTAITAVSRTLRTLLLDRMTAQNAVTIAPPDVTVTGITGGRINLYLFQVLENADLKNQEIPGQGHPATYGRPPLSLNLRYLMTTHSELESQSDADLNAQTMLGDAMQVFHEFGNRVEELTIQRPAAGTVGDPVLDGGLIDEFERVKLVLHPAELDDLTKIWSALSESNFRRSVVYETRVVQIESTEPRARPQPVETRRVLVNVRRPPEVLDAYVTPAANGPIGELRARIGDEITIISENALADRVYVRLGSLEPIRVVPPADGRIRITIPDDQYPIDLDNAAPRPIPAGQRLQPGPISVQVIAVHPTEGVAGALDHGTTFSEDRSYASNLALIQLVPRITATAPANGPAATVLQVQGTRLWHNDARLAEVIIGDAAVRIRPPAAGDPWAAPTGTQVEIPVADAARTLPALAPADPAYGVAVQVDGARSRDDGFTFRLDP